MLSKRIDQMQARFGQGADSARSELAFFGYGNIAQCLVEISGESSSGKSTLLYRFFQTVPNCTILYFTTDYKFDVLFARQQGVSSNVCIIEENELSRVFEIIEATQGIFDLIVIDSVAAILGDYGEVIDQLRKRVQLLLDQNQAIIITNQNRNDLINKYPKPWGESHLSQMCSLHICMGYVHTVKKDWMKLGRRVKADVIFNRINNYTESMEFDIMR